MRITFMLEMQYNVNIYRIPSYASSVNGQIERCHSTFTEVMRCLKARNYHNSFSELIHRSLYEYNNSVHFTMLKKPVDVFFGRHRSVNPEKLEKERLEIIKKIKKKQEEDIVFHNKTKTPKKYYQVCQKVYVKTYKTVGAKLSKNYSEDTVKENRTTTILIEFGRVVHENNITN